MGLAGRGVPPAGPMDPWSHRLANALVGNPAEAATLEITLKGPELEFEDERIVAVAGAHFAMRSTERGSRRTPRSPYRPGRGCGSDPAEPAREATLP